MMRLWKEKKEKLIETMSSSAESIDRQCHVLDMVVRALKQFSSEMRRRARRYLVTNPETAPKRYAMILASAMLLSVIITSNVLFEYRTKSQGD